jgi:nanoRNase/pAp phosphatase (c-di-AMP/oligoRNAs hydrolase)
MTEPEPTKVEPAQMAKLRAALPERGRVFIVPHNHPDPDALASAAGMHLLLDRHFGLSGQIVFTGQISRAENRALLRHYRYKWRTLSQVRTPARPVPAILVDTSPWSGNVHLPAWIRPVAVIDHHPLRKPRQEAEGLFTDIRTGAGASATMVYEYLKKCDIALPKWLATVMTYAIATETMDLSRDCSDADLAAYVELLTKANLQVLGKIRHAPLGRTYYAHLQEAMERSRLFGRVIWTHLEHVENPEIVAELADLLLRLERITWAFCTAYLNNRMVVSLRSSAQGARCGRVLKKCIGKGGTAGGHHRMAAGQIDLTQVTRENREAYRQAVVDGLVAAIEPRSRAGAGEARIEANRLIPAEEAEIPEENGKATGSASGEGE